MLKRLIASLAGAAVLLAAVLALPVQAAYPERPITLVVPWGAGGGTDAVARILAALLEKDLQQPVNVVNRTGGSGVVGHSAIAQAPADGYTIGLITVEIAMMRHVGLTELSFKDYTAIGQVNIDPGGVMVSSDSPYKSAKELLAVIKEKPAGTLKASGTGQGGIWHLGLAGWLLSEGVDPAKVPWVPSQGAAPGLKDMVAGGVDLVTASLAEGRALIEAKRVRALANMDEKRLNIFPDTPTLKEATGSGWTVGAWRVIAGPKGLPKEVTDKLVPALERAYQSKEYKDFMESRGFGMIWRAADDARSFMEKADTDLGEVMKKAGLTKN
jgi:tripartite-type tricarboxylate transporter receptor subunit TctC